MADSEDAEVVLNKTTLTAKVETPNHSQGKKKKWSNSDVQNLIEEYEARTCLWDTFSAEYHNIEETSKAKEELSVRLMSYYTRFIIFYFITLIPLAIFYILFDPWRGCSKLYPVRAWELAEVQNLRRLVPTFDRWHRKSSQANLRKTCDGLRSRLIRA